MAKTKKIHVKTAKNPEKQTVMIDDVKPFINKEKIPTIKLYGLLNIDKDLYIKIQAIVFFLLGISAITCYILEFPQTALGLILLTIVLEIFETYFALTKWAKNN